MPKHIITLALLLLTACDTGDDVTTDTGGGSSGSDGSSGSESSDGSSTGGACGDSLGQGGIENPEPGYTVSGCFDDHGAFACMTCDDWCAAGDFGECVGGAPLDNCTDEVGQGYIVACDEPFDDETAWKCVCRVEE